MLKSWNGCSLAQISSLASLSVESLKKSLKNQRGGSERTSYRVWPVLVRNEQERVSEGVWRGIYTPHTENKPLLKGYPETPGNDPDTPDPGHSGLEPGLS